MQFQKVNLLVRQFLSGAVDTMDELVLGPLMGVPQRTAVRITRQPVCAYVPATWKQPLGVWKNAQY